MIDIKLNSNLRRRRRNFVQPSVEISRPAGLISYKFVVNRNQQGIIKESKIQERLISIIVRT